nr:MAG TPA_asm: hypothetical protein [Caudoviricetes sp.]
MVRDIIAMIILVIVVVLVIPFAIICMSVWLSGIC